MSGISKKLSEILEGRSAEFWFVLAAMFIYVVQRAKDDPWWIRLGKAVTAGMLTLGVAPSLSGVFWGNEIATAIAVMLLGEVFLDTTSAVAADRQFFIRLIKRWLENRVNGGEGQ